MDNVVGLLVVNLFIFYFEVFDETKQNSLDGLFDMNYVPKK